MKIIAYQPITPIAPIRAIDRGNCKEETAQTSDTVEFSTEALNAAKAQSNSIYSQDSKQFNNTPTGSQINLIG